MHVYVDVDEANITSANATRVLIESRGEEEVLRLSTSLLSGMKVHADAFQAKLFDEFPDMRPRLIDIRLRSGTTPGKPST